jgi:hypothetical protein
VPHISDRFRDCIYLQYSPKLSVTDVRISWGNAFNLTWKFTTCAAIISLVIALVAWFLKVVCSGGVP